MRFIKLLSAFLCKNLIFLLSFDKVTYFSKNNFFFLYICFIGMNQKIHFLKKLLDHKEMGSLFKVQFAQKKGRKFSLGF